MHKNLNTEVHLYIECITPIFSSRTFNVFNDVGRKEGFRFIIVYRLYILSNITLRVEYVS